MHKTFLKVHFQIPLEKFQQLTQHSPVSSNYVSLSENSVVSTKKKSAAEKKVHKKVSTYKGTGRISEIFLARKFREFADATCREFFEKIYGFSTKSRSSFVKASRDIITTLGR